MRRAPARIVAALSCAVVERARRENSRAPIQSVPRRAAFPVSRHPLAFRLGRRQTMRETERAQTRRHFSRFLFLGYMILQKSVTDIY